MPSPGCDPPITAPAARASVPPPPTATTAAIAALQPLDVVAADVLVALLAVAAADGGAAQGTGGVAAPAFGRQCGGQRRRQGERLHRPAVAGQIVEEAVEKGSEIGHGTF